MTETLDAALDALRRQQFYEQMAQAESELRQDGESWDEYLRERNQWLDTGLESA